MCFIRDLVSVYGQVQGLAFWNARIWASLRLMEKAWPNLSINIFIESGSESVVTVEIESEVEYNSE